MCANFKEQLKIFLGQLLNLDSEHSTKNLSAYLIDTKFGKMLAISDIKSIYLLEFLQGKNLDAQILKIKNFTKKKLVINKSLLITQAEDQLNKYFSGDLLEFSVPLSFVGTTFQRKVWQNLQKIPYGKTLSYLEIARISGNEKSFRAVANANANNKIAIIVPCHRVIQSNGGIGGYAGGVSIKKQLLLHEKNNLNKQE